MARYMVYWRSNPMARPTDPFDNMKRVEKLLATMDDLLKKGDVEEFGFFPDATSGYIKVKGESTDVFRISEMYYPHILGEVKEIIPYEKGKEIVSALTKAGV